MRSPRVGSAVRGNNAPRSRVASARGAESELSASVRAATVAAVVDCLPPLPSGWCVLTSVPWDWPEEDGAPVTTPLTLQCTDTLELQVSGWVWGLERRNGRNVAGGQRRGLWDTMAWVRDTKKRKLVISTSLVTGVYLWLNMPSGNFL